MSGFKIKCIACGHNIELDEAYSEFEGAVKCWVCGTMLSIKAEEVLLKNVRIDKGGPASPAAGEKH